MVGVLTDKQGITNTTETETRPAPAAASRASSPTRERPRRPSRAATRKLAIELNDAQLEGLRAQADALGADRPTEIVLYANGRRVGEASVGRFRLYT